MGNLTIKIQGPAAAWGRSTDSSRGGSSVTYPYNRSSVAPALQEIAPPEFEPLPQPVPPRSGISVAPRSNSMFLGLDERIRSRSRTSTVVSVTVHIVVIALILWVAMAIHSPVVDSPIATVTPVHFTLYDPPPPPVMQVVKVRGGGGGGGARQIIPPTQGSLPKVVAKAPVIPLEAKKIESPKLLIQPTTTVQMPQDNSMPKLGVPHTQQVAMASQGSGTGSGFGFGLGGGVGSGHGTGQGPGGDRGYGGGVMSVGGGVSAPEVIHSVQPQFTPDARRENFQGVVAVQLIVDSQGFPQDVRVVRHLGMGLDEEAIAAVKQYKFRAATYEGHSVAVQMVIDVNFRLD
jgi:periplasmic protein TonB